MRVYVFQTYDYRKHCQAYIDGVQLAKETKHFYIFSDGNGHLIKVKKSDIISIEKKEGANNETMV